MVAPGPRPRSLVTLYWAWGGTGRQISPAPRLGLGPSRRPLSLPAVGLSCLLSQTLAERSAGGCECVQGCSPGRGGRHPTLLSLSSWGMGTGNPKGHSELSALAGKVRTPTAPLSNGAKEVSGPFKAAGHRATLEFCRVGDGGVSSTFSLGPSEDGEHSEGHSGDPLPPPQLGL